MERTQLASSTAIGSLLDTDLYKLTMQCAVLKYFCDSVVTYGYTNRTKDMQLTREAFNWINAQIDNLSTLFLSTEEYEFLQKKCPYFNSTYLLYLSNFRFKPSEHVETSFTPVEDTGAPSDLGDVQISITGPWVDTILYEIPLLAIISEAFFKWCDRDWNHDLQEEKAYQKGCRLLESGCAFSEFGTRRRRDYHTQDLVMQGLSRAAKTASEQGWKGSLSGTSNVHFAMRYEVAPVGTVAHEWYMGIAAITNDYENANEIALKYWLGSFGVGTLGIALTDTFGTPAFLKAFGKQVPPNAGATHSPDKSLRPPTYADVFTGVRQDSGDPAYFIEIVREFYDKLGITEKKTVVFSDSLNIELCLEYKAMAEKAGFSPAFGVGTFLTNDYVNLSNGKKSVPLNIVIKVSSAGGRPAVKISDNLGKNTGDSDTVVEVKKRLGYVEHDWKSGDETQRWGSKED